MSRQTREKLIEAGAVVAGPAPESSLDGTDTMTARAYRHPALGDRAVVRLVPETLGGAEDLAVEFLGFEPARPPVAVGTGRRQALGFPAWALVNDPANGHHALALVKDLERLARQAKGRPGAAKDGFDELAARLGASVPHFLPTFYEQAGRAFLAVDNKQSAATMFGKAREAERVHALPIDEARQRDVFLEFAFNGALSGKSLTQYAKDLAQRTDPVAAYELFRQVCAERVAGGLPPYAGMADDLRRLVKAAELGQAAEEEKVVRELLDSPALPHAPLPFWKSYAAALQRLSAKEPAVRRSLLSLFPQGDQTGTEDFWFTLLHDTGSLAGLTELDGVPEAARPEDGSAGWLARAVLWRARGWRTTRRSPRLLSLAQAMVPRLQAENVPLRLLDKGVDLDLLDLVLAHGLRVQLPEGRPVAKFGLKRWREDQSPGRRDLVSLAATDWAREPMRLGIDEAMRDRYGFRPDAAGRKPLDDLRPFYETRGPREALGDWLDETATAVTGGALPALTDTLDRLRLVAHGEVLGVRPDAYPRLSGADVAGALARTLRIGLFDEFGWPALEEAVAEFPVPKPHPNGYTEEPFTVADSWPALVLHNKLMAVVVGPREILLRHTFRIPKDVPSYYSRSVVFVDGRLLVLWDSESGVHGYWDDRADEVFRVAGAMPQHHFSRFGTSAPLPGGGRTFGGRPLLPGDRTVGKAHAVVSDGSGWWRLDGEMVNGRGWREFDPATGDPGRLSRPAFFEAGLEADGSVPADDWCALAPVPPGLEGTPFGTAGGLLGWRSVRSADGSGEAVSVTGDVARLRPELMKSSGIHWQPGVVGPIRMPGGGPAVALLIAGRGTSVTFSDGEVGGSDVHTGRSCDYAKGTPLVPPVVYWHALRARDEQGSAALRGITREQAAALVEAARRGRAEKAVRQVLPQITHEKLVLGVAGVLEVAVAQAERVRSLPEPVSTRPVEIVNTPEAEELPEAEPPAGAGVAVPATASDQDLGRAVAGLTERATYYGHYSGSRSSYETLPNLRGVVAVLTGNPPKKGLLSKLGLGAKKPSSADVPTTSVDWSTPVTGGLGALALRASLATTPPEVRSALMVLLAEVARHPVLIPAAGHWRRLKLVSVKSSTPQAIRDQEVEHGTMLPTRGGQAFAFFWDTEYHDGSYRGVLTALEHVTEPGDFGPVDGYRISLEREGGSWGSPEAILALLDLLAQHGPASWRPEAVDELVNRTGLTRAEAALLLAGLLQIDSYENNFLPKEVRELLGLKVAEAKTARDALVGRLDVGARLRLLSAAMPDEPADLWEKGPDVERLAREWVALFGRRVPVADELVAAFAASRKGAYTGAQDAAAVLQAMAAPAATGWLNVDLTARFEDKRLTYDGDSGFLPRHLSDTVIGLLWLAYHLPLHDPLRRTLPEVYDALRQRLAHPGLLMLFRQAEGRTLDGLRQVYGLPPAPEGPNAPEELLDLGGAGYLVSRPWRSELYVRPAALDGAGQPLLALGEAVPDQWSYPLLVARGEALARLVAELRAPEVTEGWLQDPAVSVPDLVERVSARTGLDAAAARYYLQLLALPDPTDKNVRLWNGWTPRRLKAATSALTEAGLVVEGRRARAGRSVFLPSAWLNVKAPGLPLEAWKVPLLGLSPGGASPLDLAVPVTSVRELFRLAWERVEGDDGPRLEALRTGRAAGRAR